MTETQQLELTLKVTDLSPSLQHVVLPKSRHIRLEETEYQIHNAQVIDMDTSLSETL
jgi:predicted component of type VI protein secretion system